MSKLSSLINAWDFETKNFRFEFEISTSGIPAHIPREPLIHLIKEEFNESFFNLNPKIKIFKNKHIFFQIKNGIITDNSKMNTTSNNFKGYIELYFDDLDKENVLLTISELCFESFLLLTIENSIKLYTPIENKKYHVITMDNNIDIDSKFEEICLKKTGSYSNKNTQHLLEKAIVSKLKNIIHDWEKYSTSD